MRALALLAASTIALAGCHKTRACKAGTLLVTVDMPAGTDTLQYIVTIDGTPTAAQSVTLPSSSRTSGTLELDFSMYPAGRTVTVSVVALGAGSALASGASDPRVLAASCDTLTVNVTTMVAGGDDGGSDGSGGGSDLAGGGGGCNATADCPMGEACDLTSHSCTTACTASQPCNGGCCNSGMCDPGDSTMACALGQAICGSCAGNTSGTACLTLAGATKCGCTTAKDCLANQACNTTTHTCGSACDMNTPCNGGCCSAMTAGTCQTGTAPMICGNNGALCGDCTNNQNGHKCIAVTGGGQCGCVTTSTDCPGTSTGCTSSVCVNSCSSSMACLSGCCSSATSGTCQPGTSQSVCGAVGSVCKSCVGNAAGAACLSSGACGCSSAADCPVNQACDLNVHMCTSSCNANQPCNGGCCASSGSCAVGTSTSACGSSGGLCSTCATDTSCATYSCNGTSCQTSYASSSTVCFPSDPTLCLNAAYCTGGSATCPARTKSCTTCCKGNGTCTGLACP